MTQLGRDGGFVLVEALAALTVTALTAAALLGAARVANDRSAEAAARSAALRQARDLIASSEAGPWTGIDAEGVHAQGREVWSRHAAIHPDDPNLVVITVAVDWSAGRREGTIRLEAYRYVRS